MKRESWKADAPSTGILKICLAPDNQVESAMRAWEDEYSIDVIRAGLTRFVPYLFRRLSDLKIDARDYQIIRGVYYKSWWFQTVHQKNNLAFLALLGDGFPQFTLLKGVALQQSVYSRDPRTRPCDDVDVFIQPSDRRAAVDYLMERGFVLDGPFSLEYALSFRKSIAFKRDDISIDLCWGLFEYSANPHYVASLPTREVRIEEGAFTVLDDTANLLHTCLHGAGWNREPSTRWILDAALLIQSGSIDWKTLVDLAVKNGWQYPLSKQLMYLGEFGALAPDWVITTLEQSKKSISGRAMYFYQRQSNLTIRKILRAIYAEYLVHITINELKNSPINYLKIEMKTLPTLVNEFITSRSRVRSEN